MELFDARLAARGGPYIARTARLALVWSALAMPVALGLTRCPMALFLHHACPGCGMTRALWLFVRGDLRASWAMHPLAVPSALALGLIAFATLRVTWRRGGVTGIFDDAVGRAPLVLLVALQVLSVALWIMRLFGAWGGPVPV